MKLKNVFGVFAMASMIFVTSCTQDDTFNGSVNDYVDATFTIATADAIGTRADIGDGTTVNKVKCAVYDMHTAEAVELTNLTRFEDINGKKATYNVRLGKGHKYTVVFFAYKAKTDSAYDVSDLTNVTLNDVKWCNDEDRDAFTNSIVVDTDETMNTITKTVELFRPFAQLNLGSYAADAEDAENAGISVVESQIKVSNVYTAFNAFANEVAGETSEVTFAMNTIPTQSLFVDADNDGTDEEYKYLALNYLLVGDKENEKNLTDVTFTHKAANGKTYKSTTFSNIPVQRNYRTNIIGWLLTNPAVFDIEINEGFDGDKIEEIITTTEQLQEALVEGGNIKLGADIELDSRIDITAGTDVYLNMNGKKIESSADRVFYVNEGASLTIDGNGTVETETPAPVMFCPVGNLIIKNGTFIRHIPEGYDGDVTSMFMGTKPGGGWHSAGVTINGGYFDSGYYNKNAADVEDILAGTKEFVETEDDIKKRGVSGDKNLTRVALKNNTMALFNKSNNYFKIYGGTFVGANPAWGDEGCMLPTKPNYLRPWSYYQGALLDGQTFNENGIVLPEGYSIFKGTQTEDGRPTYTVNYSK